jgi:hypothetical protein
MNTFIVRQMANLPRSDMPGYCQWFEAVDDDGDVAATIVSMTVPGHALTEREILVNEREVTATSGVMAIAAYQRWLAGQE